MRLSGLRSVRSAKITEYLLDENHATGGPKARFFKLFGFSADDPITLESVLLRHSTEREVVRQKITPHGTNSVVQCTLVTPDGRNPCIQTIWFKPPGSTAHRLVTAYPA